MLLKRFKNVSKRKILYLLLALFSVLVVWYGQSRLLSPFRSTRLLHLDQIHISDEEIPFRLGIYNIAHGRGGKRGASTWTGASRRELKAHLAKIAEQIIHSNASIVVLNEVDFHSVWNRHFDHARFIAEQAGFPYCLEQRNTDVAIPFMNFKFGNALLSKYPILSFERIPMPALSQLELLFSGNHDVLMAKVKTPLGEIYVLGVHLEYRCEDTRVQCASVIDDIVAKAELPVVAMGDFNSAPGFAKGHRCSSDNENAIDKLLNGNLSTTAEKVNWQEYLTFPSEAPSRAIDWILCSNQLVLGAPKVVHSPLSDHLMVTTDVSCPGYETAQE